MISIGIVRAKYNEKITDKMLKEARSHAKKLGIRVAAEATVPGTFDMPIMIQAMLERNDIDGVATIGAVIKGETDHDKLIANHVANAITRLSLRYKKPIGLGIIGPGVTEELAKARIVQYARQSVEAVLKVHDELARLRFSR